MLKEDENLAVNRGEFDGILRRLLVVKPLKRADVKPFRKLKVQEPCAAIAISPEGAK